MEKKKRSEIMQKSYENGSEGHKESERGLDRYPVQGD